MNGKRIKALKAAFPYTLPILAGFLFLGMAYGVYMRASGFGAIYPIAMSAAIFAGSMEFVAVNMLMGAFDPLGMLLMTLMVNARHIFYGISMLDRYRDMGAKKWYLVFGLCDETFSINCTVDVPEGTDRGWFYFFVTLLDHAYWFAGASIGALAGAFITFNTEGLDFVMTALFIVIFLEQILKEKSHAASAIGAGASVVCLIIFGGGDFIIPAMLCILALLTLYRGRERGDAK